MLVLNQSLVNEVSWNVRKRIAGPVLRKLCKGSGMAVKLGQMLSTRTDLFDKQTLLELSTLQSNYEPLDYETINNLCLQDPYLKRNITSITPVPLGSASIAQVHKVQLKSGETAVVKVKRPGLHQTTLQQRQLVSYLTLPLPTLRSTLLQCFDLFLNELDFQQEAANMREFAELSLICTVPKVLYSSSDILLLEYVPGVLLSESSLPPKEIINKVIKSYLAQIFVLGRIHGDPHPGNLAITEQGGLVLYDFGCCVEVKAPELLITATLFRNADWLRGLLEDVPTKAERKAVTQSLDTMLRYLTDTDLQGLHERMSNIPSFTQEFMLLLRVFS